MEGNQELLYCATCRLVTKGSLWGEVHSACSDVGFLIWALVGKVESCGTKFLTSFVYIYN